MIEIIKFVFMKNIYSIRKMCDEDLQDARHWRRHQAEKEERA